MAVREILLYARDEAALRRKCDPVRKHNDTVRTLIQDLKDTLSACPNGAGLAAPQIGEHQRVVVVRLGLDEALDAMAEPPMALVNPRILAASDERRDFDGCLSFPGFYGTTRRPHILTIRAQDEAGKTFEREYRGFDAVLIHHEIDHLDGVLFIDRIEQWEDLYFVQDGPDGQPERVPVSEQLAKQVFHK